MMKLIAHEITSPWGKIATIVDVTKSPEIIGAGFKPLAKLLKQLDLKNDYKITKDSKLAGIHDNVKDWIDGDLVALTKVRVSQAGAEFSQDCWKQLLKIKPGKVITYAQLAKNAGNSKAVRAAGSACAKNLIAPFVPCHRVINTGGAIGNYAFGVKLKRSLLHHEGVTDIHF
jgi:methylated-DNA-[protein]-cysteine S-methyltransferase